MRVVIFDTETTGLIENHVVKLEGQPHVIELYACRANLDDGSVEDELNLLLRPPSPELVTKKISEITGLTYDALADAPTFADKSCEILQYLGSRDAIIAHNLSFDMEMVDIECERIGAKMEWPKRKICTVEQTIHVKGFRMNLSLLHEWLFSEKFEGAHRAKTDVTALLRCCVELRKRGMI
jgi:DNA polymerase-3 subunit epsilon